MDGSGKSTQLELLRDRLVSQGKKVAYFHAVEFSSANKIARFFQGKKDFLPGQEKAVTQASWLSLHIRLKFLFLDMVRFWFLRRKLREEKYDYLLSDRFFYDSIINIEYLSQKISFLKFSIDLGTAVLAKWMPKADRAFYFDISPEVIMSRDRVPEQGSDYMIQKIDLFKKRKEQWHFIMIDASKSKEEVFEEITMKL